MTSVGSMMETNICNDIIQECEPIMLEPFHHQVGGHSSILCLDERTICKPYIKQEVKFYETLPTCMKKFTPEYGGTVQVRYETDSQGYSTTIPTRPSSKSNRNHQVSINKKIGKSRLIPTKSSGSLESESELNDLFESEEDGSGRVDGQVTMRRRRSDGGPRNPWALKCHKEHISKLRNLGLNSRDTLIEKESTSQKFVLLENLTWRFEYPCILDLKMGTRQYGDDATPDKIKSQIAKATSSTSVQLGVRICGMQVYQTTTGLYEYRNKYYGRKLAVNGFEEGLYNFLYNGNRLRKDTLIPLIKKLIKLKTIMMTLDTFRFYTSSLLLIYEGLDPEYIEQDDDNDDDDKNDDDNQQQQRLTSLSTLALEQPCCEYESYYHSMVTNNSNANLNQQNNNVENPKKSTDDTLESLSSFQNISTTFLSSECVDVRLIDFAHSTHNGLDSTIEHIGPDNGFIFGLTNLIQILQNILNDGKYLYENC